MRGRLHRRMAAPLRLQPLQQRMQRLEAQGCSHAAMEASSHGLVQWRLDGVVLRAAALTHITRDHL
ncbi:MAG: Mur ligase family protein, partial [Pseudomonadota bacterium]